RIKHSASIDDLKEAIRAKKPSFERIAADSLTLFKFQLPLESLREDYAQSIKLEDDQLLKGWMDIPECYRTASGWYNHHTILIPEFKSLAELAGLVYW
ncbi:hypothetical protein L208DRAFT_1413179, partial [Tricholoma matsutake]